MSNDTAPTVELVRSETTGYLGPNGEFIYGTPPETERKPEEVYVQTGEDVE